MPANGALGTVAVSECLLGVHVRWDGDHNAHDWPLGVAKELFALVGVCPEVGIGLGVPRPPIHLVDAPNRPRAVAVADPNRDYTDRLRGFAARAAKTLNAIDGYIFATRSPSCGLRDVKVFARDGTVRGAGRGVYAAAVLEALPPDLPAVEAHSLANNEALLRFALRVTARSARAVEPAALRKRIARLSTRPGQS